MANTTPIEQHPDLMELRARYDRVSETPQARGLEGLTFLTGLYTAISAWVVGFGPNSDVAVTNLIVGVALTLLAAGFASAYGRTHNLAWVAPLIGVWVIITPWVLLGSAPPTGMIVSNVVAGGLAVLFGGGLAAIGNRSLQRAVVR